MNRLFFRVIAFNESEKSGLRISLNKTLERSQAYLGISQKKINTCILSAVGKFSIIYTPMALRFTITMKPGVTLVTKNVLSV
jgi:hypothetical protein